MSALIGLQPEKEYLLTWREVHASGVVYSSDPPNPYREDRAPLTQRTYGPVLSYTAKHSPYPDDEEAREAYEACALTIAVVDGEYDPTRTLNPRVRWLPFYPVHGVGHAWGYGGSGPHQLALDLLLDALGEWPKRQDMHNGRSLAWLWHNDFCDAFCAKGDRYTSWELTGVQIAQWLDRQRARYPHDERRVEIELRIELLAAQMQTLESYDERDAAEANAEARRLDNEITQLLDELTPLYNRDIDDLG